MTSNHMIYEWVEVHAALVAVGDLIRHPLMEQGVGARVSRVGGEGFYIVLGCGKGGDLWMLREETVHRWQRVESQAVS